MNKVQFINEVAKRNRISYGRAYHYVNDVVDCLRIVLSQGKKVQLGGFGTFEVLTYIRGERIPVFKGGKALKKVLNTIKGE